MLRPRCGPARGVRPDFLMNIADWMVFLATLGGIAAYGSWRTYQIRSLNTYLKGRRSTGGHNRPVRNGHAGERDYLPFDSGTGLREWHRIRTELFRIAARAH